MDNIVFHISEWDANALLWIQENLRNDVLSGFFRFFTRLGNHGELWLGILLILLLLRKHIRTVSAAMASLVCTFVAVDLIIKPIVARIRPYLAISDLSRLVAAEKSFSFPSGHASTAFAVAYVLFRELPFKYGFPILLLAGLMAFSRMYVGVHYPTDVMIGMAVGTVVGEICIRIRNTLERKWKPGESRG